MIKSVLFASKSTIGKIRISLHTLSISVIEVLKRRTEVGVKLIAERGTYVVQASALKKEVQ